MDEDDLDIIAQPIDNPRPHVVILGAGASRAAFPQGDARGRMLPLLNDLVGAVGLDEEWSRLLKLANPPPGTFEEQYSWCKSSGHFVAELMTIEERIVAYFSTLELPQTPTVYDHLILGLRPQDIVASFNWDPLLMMSCHEFDDNKVRLHLFVLAYNLGNFLRQLVLPREIKRWTLTTTREKLIKIGAKIVRHARRVVFQLAEVAVPRRIFLAILCAIDRLRLPMPAPG